MPTRSKTQISRRRTFLREWREWRGLSQEKAAELLGITQGTLSRLESGKHGYTQENLERAAAAYGCAPADLLLRHPEQKQLEDRLNSAPDEVRKRISAVVKTLLDEAG